MILPGDIIEFVGSYRSEEDVERCFVMASEPQPQARYNCSKITILHMNGRNTGRISTLPVDQDDHQHQKVVARPGVDL